LSILFSIFIMFVKLCAFAFGGGYVMIPSMIQASEVNNWATAAELTDVIAIAGMSPGPVAVNAAVGFGYKVAGFPGAVAAFLGIAVPCSLIVIIVATFFFKVYSHKAVQSALYGLRPVIASIILFAAVSLAMKNNIIFPQKLIQSGINISAAGYNLFEAKSLAIAVVTFAMLKWTKIQPIWMIVLGGGLGIFLFI